MSDDIDATIRDATCPTHPVTAADRAIWAAATRAALERAANTCTDLGATAWPHAKDAFTACAAAIRAIADGCAE